MKQIIKNIFQLIFLILIFSGCSKSFLNKTPDDSVPLSQAFTNPDDLNGALNGAYAELRDPGCYGVDFLINGDVQADNTYVATNNYDQFIPQYIYDVLATDPTPQAMWTSAYIGILRANQIITAPIMSGLTDTIKAQAYAIRAILYFKLINIFATPYTVDSTALGVPLILNYNPYLLPTRNSVKEVYNQIINDLRTAFKNAPDYSSSVLLSKYAIEGLLARAYLYEGDNADAKVSAVDVINSGPFSLVTPSNFNAYWADPGIQTDAVETLFEVDADGVDNNGLGAISGYYINGENELFASSQLYALYSSTDVRRSLLIPGTTNSGAAAYLVNKYPNFQNTADPDNLKVIRLAEVYLIAAEASLPTNENDARYYLNLLMAQRDGYVYTSTGNDLLNNIVQERRKELAFEGDRLYDMNRLKLTIDRVYNPGAILAGPNNEFLTIPFPYYGRIAPIPAAEIQVNPNLSMQQNPGY
jgi:starch-binding outer membrane protein, SusD/RagB family